MKRWSDRMSDSSKSIQVALNYFTKKPIVKDPFDRAWKRKLELEWHIGPTLAWNTYITRFEGNDMYPRMVSSYFARFVFKEWKIEAWHMYYDGANCVWQLGPFIIGRAGHDYCKKCSEENER